MSTVLFDYFPLMAFFLAYKLGDIYWATGALMLASLLQTLIGYWRTRVWKKMHLYLLGSVLLFGGLTLLLHDDRLLKLKVTLVFWIIAAVFLFRQWWGGQYTVKDLLEAAMQDDIAAPQSLWSRLNIVWALCKFVIGALNLYVAFILAPGNNDLWVNFKVWGISAIEMGLLVYTIHSLYSYFPVNKDEQN